MRRTALFIALITTLAGLWGVKTTADIILTKFEATWETDYIHIVWETSKEVDTEYYYLYRAESANGPWGEFIDNVEAEGGVSTPASYSYDDPDVTPGVIYYYLLEEETSEDRNSIGPIMATQGTSQGTNTPTATRTPTAVTGTDSDVQPTATRQYTLTPSPANTVLATTLTPPSQAPIPPRSATAQPTRILTPQITTPTPVGGPGESLPTPLPVPSITLSPPAGIATEMVTGATATPSATPTPTAHPPAATSIPTETPQRLAAVSKETAHPLLDTTAAQLSPGARPPGQSVAGPNATEPGSQAPDTRLIRLLSVLGGAALVAAALLGAIAVLTWRPHSR